MSLHKLLAVGVLVLTLPVSAFAASKLKVNGFTTAGFSATDTSESYSFADENGSFSESTIMGIQMRFSPNKTVPISFVTQFIARARTDWDMSADWAYVGWQATDSLAVNIGRIKAPIFMISEAYDVGVTYPWINPPEEIYGFANVPFTSITGISFDYNYDLDESWARAQFYIGRDNIKIPALGLLVEGEVTQLAGFTLSWGTDELEVRFAAVGVKVKMDLLDVLFSTPQAQAANADLGNDMIAAIAALSLANAGFGDPVAAATDLGAIIASAAQFEQVFSLIQNDLEGDAGFFSLSGRYNGDRLLLMAEIGKRPVSGIPFPDTVSGFVTMGYRFGKWMPHLTYSSLDTSDSDLVNQSQTAGMIGVRYDIQPWAALKLDIQHIELDDAQYRSADSPLTTPLTSSGLFNEFPDLTTFTADVPQSLNKINIAITMVF